MNVILTLFFVDFVDCFEVSSFAEGLAFARASMEAFEGDFLKWEVCELPPVNIPEDGDLTEWALDYE